MKEKIVNNIDNLQQLELLHKADKKNFKCAFYEVYPQIEGQKIADYWKFRLDLNKKDSTKINIKHTAFLIIVCILTSVLVESYNWFNALEKIEFLGKNISLILFFGLSIYHLFTKEIINLKQILLSLLFFLISAVYINFLPFSDQSDSLFIVYIHMPFMLWCFYGFIFCNFEVKEKQKWMRYIKYNGNLLISGFIFSFVFGILTSIIIMLFSSIGISLEEFFTDHLGLWMLVSTPVIITHIIRSHPPIIDKLFSIIANIFSPIVLIILVIYLISIIITGENPYQDRDFLIFFNILILGVLAIILYSISETSTKEKSRFIKIVLLSLTVITLIINLIVLYAIILRIEEYNFTANRTIVLGSNFLTLGHLIILAFDLYKINFKKKKIKEIEITVVKYFPIYFLWIIFVVFSVPFIFDFK